MMADIVELGQRVSILQRGDLARLLPMRRNFG